MENAVGLVMTGGGARGAYQAGVLKRIGKLKRIRTQGNPFPIIGGASAGAINGSALATGCHDFAAATKRLAEVWATLGLVINQQTPQRLIKSISFETLVNHYRQHELPDTFNKTKPGLNAADEDRKSYSTQVTYEGYLKKWILPRLRSG